MTRSRWIRSVLGAICLFLAIGVVVSANVGLFVHRELYNTSAFTKHASSLLANASVRDSIAESITDELVANIPALNVARTVVETAVATAIGTNEFRTVFARATTQLHAQLVAGADTLTLDLGAAVEPILRELTGGIPFVSALISQLTGVLEVTVITKAQAPQLWLLVENTDRAYWVSLIATLVLLIAALGLIPRVWFGLMGVGGTVVIAAIAGLVSVWGLRVGLQGQFAPGLAQDTYGAVFHEFAGPYIRQTVMVLVLGVVVLAAGGAGEVTSLRLRARVQRTDTPAVTSGSLPRTPSSMQSPAPTSRPGPPLLDE